MLSNLCAMYILQSMVICALYAQLVLIICKLIQRQSSEQFIKLFNGACKAY